MWHWLVRKVLVVSMCTNHRLTYQKGIHFLSQMCTPNVTRIQLISILLFGEVMHNAHQLYPGHIWCRHFGQEVPEWVYTVLSVSLCIEEGRLHLSTSVTDKKLCGNDTWHVNKVQCILASDPPSRRSLAGGEANCRSPGISQPGFLVHTRSQLVNELEGSVIINKWTKAAWIWQIPAHRLKEE